MHLAGKITKRKMKTIGLYKETAFLASPVRRNHIWHVGLSEVYLDCLPGDNIFPSPNSNEQISDDRDFLLTVAHVCMLTPSDYARNHFGAHQRHEPKSTSIISIRVKEI